MRVVVTGGSGFIGSHVVDRLRAADHDVAVIDFRPPHRPDVAHHEVDIGDLAGLVRATQGADVVLRSYHELYGQEFTILRYGIPYGPRMRPSLVIPRFVGMARAGEPITVHGDGSQYRNYVYVEDLAEAHVLALGEASANEVFN